jgi:hypothetical protein
MTAVRILPTVGGIYLDARADGHALRVSAHPEADLCVLSIWRDGRCAASFQLPRAEVPDLVDTLVRSLAALAPGAEAAPTALGA